MHCKTLKTPTHLNSLQRALRLGSLLEKTQETFIFAKAAQNNFALSNWQWLLTIWTLFLFHYKEIMLGDYQLTHVYKVGMTVIN